ncbi:MAG: hypothetical protein AAGA93_09610, partial [Actinomycetota bacterium]
DSNRGLMALEPMAQVAEAALWDRTGPAWRSQRPTVERIWPADDAVDAATFDVRWPAAGLARIEVRRSGSVPTPACGAPIAEATKSSPTYEVVSIV